MRVTRDQGDQVAARLGLVGGSLGVVAGLVEVTVGAWIRSWVGDKADTVRLGLMTAVLGAIAVAAAIALARQAGEGAGVRVTATRRLAVVTGLLLPGLIGFTTVGRLWYAPGALLLAAGLTAAVGLRGEGSELVAAAECSWATTLTVGLALLYVALGVTALGPAGALGVAGGLLVLLVLLLRDRLARWSARALIVLAVTPFAFLTWWSVVTPILAVLLVTVGLPALSESRSGRLHPAVAGPTPKEVQP